MRFYGFQMKPAASFAFIEIVHLLNFSCTKFENSYLTTGLQTDSSHTQRVRDVTYLGRDVGYHVH
ncbi:hypothetical protein J6590_013083 [Homalodisca vitripennis]|nr:hypothetical protein J6590_013083 [Homalodisca vitripennis]